MDYSCRCTSEVFQGEIQMMLYKYSRISSNLKTNLKERQVWFSAPRDFNDIDDSALRIDFKLTDEDILKEVVFFQQQIYAEAMRRGDHQNELVDLQNSQYRER